ncbi:MAG: hypothetical protein CYG60_08530 [Actinobacteria bacterium]|nr:MAG: hypothetical protein CYG60_08530 [Actinomycetota bacterium]
MAPELETELVVEEGFPSELPGMMGGGLLRLLQEALINALKHSGGRCVRVSLRCEGGEIEAEVADDGAGFETDASSSGLGLASMRERAVALGGRLEITSDPARGTRVSIRAPGPS